MRIVVAQLQLTNPNRQVVDQYDLHEVKTRLIELSAREQSNMSRSEYDGNSGEIWQ